VAKHKTRPNQGKGDVAKGLHHDLEESKMAHHKGPTVPRPKGENVIE